MPCRTFDKWIAPRDLCKTIDRYFEVAFGPHPDLYQRISCCGWRPIADNLHPRALMAAIDQHQANLPGSPRRIAIDAPGDSGNIGPRGKGKY